MKAISTHFDLDANKAVLFERYRIYFILLVYSAVLDGLSTMYFMGRVGPEMELNAVVRELSYTLGIVYGPIVGKILQVVAVWFITALAPYLTRGLCAIIMCANCYAFVINMNVDLTAVL